MTRGAPARRIAAVPAAALVFLAAAPAAAQTVVGTVVEEGSGAPLAATFVVLEDPGGEVRARALTGRDGAFRIGAPGPGRWRLRTERIGFEPGVSPELELAAGEVRTFRFRVATRPVRLDDIAAEDRPRCGRVGVQEAVELQRVWDEARKALSATVWTGLQPHFRFDVVLHSRLLGPDGDPEGEPTYTEARFYGRHPFRAVPKRDLALGGFVQRRPGRIAFHAPDAEVLLSDSFVDRHCFRIDRATSAGVRQVGLVFEPVPGGRVTDIEGVMWLDERTAELRRVEFRYVGLDISGDRRRLGGRVEFTRLPAGEWIVRRWWIRTPVLGWPDSEGELDPEERQRRRRLSRYAWVDEGGGEVVAVWRTSRLPGTVAADTLDVRLPPDRLVTRFDYLGPVGGEG
ncbi:MAG: carboxypeptidase-like regulatory domain-containing protein [Gemmatimonadota bacterium]|nr:carboxypeptidase-like regulatory domain-containing protein [Gemmatimonadota bacterium]